MLEVYASPDNRSTRNDLQVGFYTLSPEAASQLHFDLIREWLRACDHHFDCNKGPKACALPTRLLGVGDKHSSSIRLRDSEQGETGDYVTPSHCWGKLSINVTAKYITTSETINDRHRGIAWTTYLSPSKTQSRLRARTRQAVLVD